MTGNATKLEGMVAIHSPEMESLKEGKRRADDERESGIRRLEERNEALNQEVAKLEEEMESMKTKQEALAQGKHFPPSAKKGAVFHVPNGIIARLAREPSHR
jgi:uncharacterized protein YlxW (UPF0749 family)